MFTGVEETGLIEAIRVCHAAFVLSQAVATERPLASFIWIKPRLRRDPVINILNDFELFRLH